jgi:hypothetical protein
LYALQTLETESRSLFLLLSLLGTWFSLAIPAAFVYWNFEIRKVIQAYYAEKYSAIYQMRALYTLLLGPFYINYCINELLEMEAPGKV